MLFLVSLHRTQHTCIHLHLGSQRSLWLNQLFIKWSWLIFQNKYLTWKLRCHFMYRLLISACKWHHMVCVLHMMHCYQHAHLIKTSASIFYITLMILDNHGQKSQLDCCRVMQPGGDNNSKDVFFIIANFEICLIYTTSSIKCNLVSWFHKVIMCLLVGVLSIMK